MNLRITLLAALSAGLAACATTAVERDGARPTAANSGVTASIVHHRSGSFSASYNIGARLQHLNLEKTKISRAQIANIGDPKIERHENAPPQKGPTPKTLNFGSSEDAASTVWNAQNGLINGGWQKFEDRLFHSPSGLICQGLLTMTLNVTGVNGETTTSKLDVPLTQVRNFNDAGNDVACDYVNQSEGAYFTFFASEWPATTKQDHFSAALKHITDRFDVATETTVVAPNISFGESDHNSTIEGEDLTGAFLLNPQDGVTVKTALWLNKTGNWHVKTRATYVVATEGADPGSLTAAEFLAAVFHAAKLRNVDIHINSSNSIEVGF